MDKQHVLVAEDEALLHDILQDALEEAGFAVTLSASAEDAIALLENQDAAYVALVTDIHLTRTGMTGWDIARRARELNGALPVIYTTGAAAEEWPANGVPNTRALTRAECAACVVKVLVDAGRRLGVDDLVLKSVRRPWLAARVGQHRRGNGWWRPALVRSCRAKLRVAGTLLLADLFQQSPGVGNQWNHGVAPTAALAGRHHDGGVGDVGPGEPREVGAAQSGEARETDDEADLRRFRCGDEAVDLARCPDLVGPSAGMELLDTFRRIEAEEAAADAPRQHAPKHLHGVVGGPGAITPLVAPLEQIGAHPPVIQCAECEAADVLVGGVGGDAVEPPRPFGFGGVGQLSPLRRRPVSRHRGGQVSVFGVFRSATAAL
jgi:CheY-like chemotaxis protein